MSERSPKISIITPSFNCAHLIRNCIESVMAQDYANFEHIIIDGGSTDGTTDILKQYSHLRWISEPDSGEANALNKGLKCISGDILNWLNADDVYFDRNVLGCLCREAEQHSDCDVWFGRGLAITDQETVAWYRTPLVPVTLARLLRWTDNPQFFQPAMFYSRRVVEALGPFREDLKYGIDYEYWLRIAGNGYQFHCIDQLFALATLVRTGAKSSGSVEEQHMQWQELCVPYVGQLAPTERVNYWRDYFTFRIRNPANYQRPLELPEGFEELQGFVIAALELGHMPFAGSGVNALTTIHPTKPETFWLLSEVLYRSGDLTTARSAYQHGTNLARNSSQLASLSGMLARP